MAERVEVYKTYKNFIGGAYERSESGRSQEIGLKNRNIRLPLSSRKDLRNAVEAARKAGPSWRAKSAYNRGQIIYRIGEMLEERKAEFVGYLSEEGVGAAKSEVEAAIDRTVYIAGWADKYQQVLSSVNPVNGPYYVSSSPEAIGVIALVTDRQMPLLSLITRALLAITAGNSVVVISGHGSPAQLALAEVLQASDLPGGVINIISGDIAELLPIAASHKDIGGLDLSAGMSKEERVIIAAHSTSNLKRLIEGDNDWNNSASASPSQLEQLSEIKTVWHPLGY